ncbi:MAG: hypothetical protein AABW41_00540 [Nanoarchaeota archaeon]
MTKKIKSVYVFASLSIVGIGLLNLLSVMSKKIKDLLALNKAIGPYSGKVILGILIGLLFALLYYSLAKDNKINFKKWNIFFVVSLLIGLLLIFTPFLELFE